MLVCRVCNTVPATNAIYGRQQLKLEKIEVKKYRSLFDGNSPVKLDLGEGVNSITGPNNVGKSNVFRALALALDPDFVYNRSLDMPSVGGWAKPAVTLTFRVPANTKVSSEKTLLNRVDAYEHAVKPDIAQTYASQGIVKLRVTIEGSEGVVGKRREVFVANGGGALSLTDDDPILVKALEKFHECFHFVMISSGQSLESLMEGKFRDILHNVLREDLKKEYEAAELARGSYMTGLQDGLLKPLTERIGGQLKDLFPEIDSVVLTPDVLDLDETLSKMRVSVADAALTDLADKGTGVRGGLIVAILRHFADVGKRSLLFAVEEPESFLHPAAQEQLREDLEALAERKDVSLLVSTHSPYIVSKRPESKVFALSKGANGATRIEAEARGDEPHAGVLGGLFRDRLFIEWLDRAVAIPSDTKLTLVVEGGTDQAYAEIALRKAGREDLLEGLRFMKAGDALPEGGGASLAVMQAIITEAMSTTPVTILLDNDEPGQHAAATLARIREKTKLWGEKKTLFSYRLAFDGAPKDFPYEAEDLWPDHLIEKFLAAHPDEEFFTGKRMRPNPDKGWHYDINMQGKSAFVGYLKKHVKEEDCARWVRLYEAIRAGALPVLI